MENTSNIGNLFAFSQDPVVCVEHGFITYMNASALSLFGREMIGAPEHLLLPMPLPDVASDSFVASAKINQKIVTVTRSKYENQILYSFILPDEKEYDSAITAVSSSLRDLINGIKMTSDLMSDMSSQYEDRRLQQYTAILNHYSAKMKRLVNNYALHSAFQSNAQPFNPLMDSVNKIIIDICNEIELYSLPRNIKLSFKSNDEISASVDAPLLSQMLLNIISNSLNHMPNGGEIKVDCFCKNQFITISIEDNGTGIPTDVLSSVFKSYSKQDNLSNLDFSAGLGLSVADAVAKLHGGTMIIQSVENQGTKVIVQFPRVIDTRLMSPKIEYRIPMKESIMTDLSTWLTWEDYLPKTK